MTRPPTNVFVAFAIHLFTASGAFWAFLALVAAAESRFTAMFVWLGVALFVDGIDGPMARAIDIKSVLPNWSGDMLDSIIDYTTFCLIPAFALYQSGFLEELYSFLAAALIVITSAIYYADKRMKTRDNFFKGFPVCWNMLVFTLFVIAPGWYVAFVLVVASAALTFAPVLFVHPVRVRLWRPLTLTMFGIWTLCGVYALWISWSWEGLNPIYAPLWVKIGIAVSAAYLYLVGLVLQLTGRGA